MKITSTELLILIPILLVELILVAVALGDLIRRKRAKGPKWLWALIILLVSMIGPIIYLLFGRVEDDASDSD